MLQLDDTDCFSEDDDEGEEEEPNEESESEEYEASIQNAPASVVCNFEEFCRFECLATLVLLPIVMS